MILARWDVSVPPGDQDDETDDGRPDTDTAEEAADREDVGGLSFFTQIRVFSHMHSKQITR